MVTLENIEQHTIPFDQFRYKWRFTEAKYNVLPEIHLEQILPLNGKAARFLMDLTVRSGMFNEEPFGKSYFKYVDAIQIPNFLETEQPIKKWLYQRGLPFERQVYASGDDNRAVITTWKMIVKYWSDFYYPGSDDLIVVDKTLGWGLLFFHEDVIFFGTNKERHDKICEVELSNAFDDR